MEQAPHNSNEYHILRTCTILITLSSLITIIMGTMTGNIKREINELNTYVIKNGNVQEDFQKTLETYIGSIQDVTDYIIGIRPANEKAYISFLRQVENIGQELSLQLLLRSIDSSQAENSQSPSKFLQYMIVTQGSQTSLINFLEKLEELPYFIGIERISYQDPENNVSSQAGAVPSNITIIITAYVK